MVWGGEDIVSLAKEVISIAEDKEFEPVRAQGRRDGRLEAVGRRQVKEVSKWPSRAEQLSILVGQILSPGAKLSAQLLGPGGKLASQIKKKSEGEEAADEGMLSRRC